jgi:hypothetical protein
VGAASEAPFDASLWSAKGAEMSPAPEFELTGQVGIALLVIPGILDLPKQERGS